jgi:histidinol-phosphate aminotransferase
MGKSYLFDYSLQKSNEIDMRLTGQFLAERKINSPELGELVDTYPSNEITEQLKSKLARRLSINAENIVIGAGSNGILQNLMRIFFKKKGELVVTKFSFEQPEYAVLSLGGEIKRTEHNSDFTFNFSNILKAVTQKTKAIFLCNPNNPTGIYENPQDIINLAKKVNIPIIVSEASIEFTRQKSLLDYRNLPQNLIVLRSFSKAYGLSGLRVGYAYMHTDYKNLYKENATQFEVATPSLLIASQIDETSVNENIVKVREQLFLLKVSLSKLYIPTTNSSSCCLMSTKSYKKDFFDKLRKHGISVVEVEGNAKDEKFFRVAVQKVDMNKKFIETMEKILT